MLAGRHLRRHPEAEPVVLVVTDGEPTAHLEADGLPVFQWPTTPATVRATVGEVDALTRYGVALNFFLLGDDPGLARFVDAVARRNGGRVFTPESAGSASTSSPTTSAPVRDGAAPPDGRRTRSRTGVRGRDLNVTFRPLCGSVVSNVCDST